MQFRICGNKSFVTTQQEHCTNNKEDATDSQIEETLKNDFHRKTNYVCLHLWKSICRRTVLICESVALISV